MNPRRFSRALLSVPTVIVLAVAAFLVGCGDDDQKGSEPAREPRVAETRDREADAAPTRPTSAAQTRSAPSAPAQSTTPSAPAQSTPAQRTTPSAPADWRPSVVDGDLIRGIGTNDIFVVKVAGNGDRFKRLILNPTVFNSYGWDWAAVKDVPREMLSMFTISDLARMVGDDVVYITASTGEDTGVKWRVTNAYDPNAVFTINATEFVAYEDAPEQTSANQRSSRSSDSAQATVPQRSSRSSSSERATAPQKQEQVRVVVVQVNPVQQGAGKKGTRNAQRVQEAQASEQSANAATTDAVANQEAADVNDEDALVIENGDLIRRIGGRNVYIVKIVRDGEKLFKRLILSPAIFDSYGWSWEAVKEVDADVLDMFTDSGLVRQFGSSAVYALWATGEDTGFKELLTYGGYDPDAVFMVSADELAEYTLYQDPQVQGIVDGDLIRGIGTNDIFVVKVAGNGDRFKRLILNPTIFDSYGWSWGEVQDVAPEVLNQFTTSDLVRMVGDATVYRTVSTGADTGAKWRMTDAYDPNAVFAVNATEFASYIGG